MRSWILPVVAGLSLAGCVRVPTGPNVMVLPGYGKGFDQFAADDGVCRQWAAQQIGTSPNHAANQSAAASAAVGTVLGGATGAAIGAAAGNPAMGAAVGAGAGLFGGSMVGVDASGSAQSTQQRRYDVAYSQCMYLKGNQVPVPTASLPHASGPPPSAHALPNGVPPPPPGAPPAPPPGQY